MRFVVVSTCLLFTNFGLIACNGESGTPSSNQGGSSSAATTATGGSSTSSVNRGGSGNSQSSGKGGTVATGGTSATSNGSIAAGGSTEDNTTASGGNGQTGGTLNSTSTSKGGGSSTAGGTSARGGTSATAGGTTAQSGSTTRGGTSGVGGSSSSLVGGTTARGGSASGGSATGGSATGGVATGGTQSGITLPPVQNGKTGKTTRYWDCCMPSCAWSNNAKSGGKNSPAQVCGKDGNSPVGESAGNACDGNGKSGYQCNWGAPWDVSPTVSYGYVAFNNGCGKCFQLDFNGSGDNAGAKALKGKSMVVQAINIGGIAGDQFDLLIPGGGVGAMNACVPPNSNPMWGSADGGAQYGGFLAKCGDNMSCVTDMCNKAFSSNTQVMAGCKWFTGWFGGANNPGVTYAEVPCPAALTDKSKLK
ncbi:MAG TPA: hypothetical protein VIV60_09455 [Polyangiaceae bacterium]